MIVVVFSKPDLDCIVGGRGYYLFDTGMATAFLILMATELGLVAHPMGGFRERRVKRTLGIPDEMRVIALVVVGRRSETLSPVLTESQKEGERGRPERMPLEEFVHLNRYGEGE
ncbi:MAG: nitroreductase family protein [Candidatus Bathyarchaeia archaeon]